MIKKLCSIILSLCIIFSIVPSVYGNDNQLQPIDDFDYFRITDEFIGKDYKYYTAIGDSISTGYGLSSNYNGSDLDSNNRYTKYKVDSFVNLLGESLKDKEVANLSSSNTSIEDLLLALRQLSQEKYIDQIFKEYIEQAKVITITLGEDILLNPIKEAIDYKISQSSKKITEEEAINSIFEDENETKNLLLDIDKNIKKFIGSKDKNYEDGQFMQIIELIRDINSYGDVVVQTIYNPYKDIKSSSKLDGFIRDINLMIKQNSSKQTYKVVDTYSLFENTDKDIFTNGSPYPNALGHELIYKEHINFLVPKLAPTN